MMDVCRLCDALPLHFAIRDNLARHVQCKICGEYVMEADPWSWLAEGAPGLGRRYLLSAVARTAPLTNGAPFLFSGRVVKDVLEGRFREPTFIEKRESLLDWFAYQSRRDAHGPYGARVKMDPTVDYPAAFCRDTRGGNWNEWNFIFQPLISHGFITDTGGGLVRITDTGWEHLETKRRSAGDQAFIAMAFREDMTPVYEAITAAVTGAGYLPLRIDRAEYLGGVMDEVLARIRESRFVVADLTYNRGGVYYEAGFALGLGLPTIPICREDHIDGPLDTRVHFDVQHLNLLAWRDRDLSSLTARLQNRIVALFGRGPH